MKNEELKVGDIVRLKSGGPKMVVGKTDSGMATCHFFNDQGCFIFETPPPLPFAALSPALPNNEAVTP